MAAPTVYENVAENADVRGQLFAGKKFFVAQRVPQRNHFLHLIQSNGGNVVKLEKTADYMIADHFRRDCPPGSLSYTFIEKSIKAGELQDPEDHCAGPRAGIARDVGSTSRPTKGGRAAYTTEEDRTLFKWVRDAEAQGGLVSGNEIYKQLEAKYPRHTWQSWRDRYLKQLRNRPPSAFNIPDNAPPSPPSDEPAEPAPKAATTAAKPTRKLREASSSKNDSTEGKTVNKDDYTVDDFDKIFGKEHWEELYGNKETIDECSGEQYFEAWKAWAKGTKQSAEAWRQYFGKVIRPQWERDPVWKRDKIRKIVRERHEEEFSQRVTQESQAQDFEAEEPLETKPESPNPASKSPKGKRKRDETEDVRFERYLEERHKGKPSSAYIAYARENKWPVWNERPNLDYTELHTLLMAQWDALSAEEKAPYFDVDAAEELPKQSGISRKSPQVWLSSSTVIHETPKYITEAYNKALKKIHEGTYPAEVQDEHVDVEVDTPRQLKRQKRESTSPPRPLQQPELGTQGQQPIVLSSNESSLSDSQSLLEEDLEDDVGADAEVRDSEPPLAVNEPELAIGQSDSDIGSEDLDAIAPPKGLEPMDSSDYPSNTPTPRAPRHKSTAFDTQAVLSSPSQAFSLQALPRPPDFTEDLPRDSSPTFQPSSPPDDPASEASTTHSLQEFRRSLNEHDNPLLPLAPLRSSPPPSSPAASDSSTASGDPDPPLDPSELDLFFEEQHEEDVDNKAIAAALRRTRLRPALAADVLAAWREERPLPVQRGIWSAEDDEDVESGDGVALARLERKHTFEGWGGVVERMRFLTKCREKGG